MPGPAGTVSVFPPQLRAPFVAFPEVVQYQLVHDRDELRVPIVLRPGTSGAVTNEIAAALARALASAGAGPLHIAVTAVEHLDQDGGIAGKYAVITSVTRHRQRC